METNLKNIFQTTKQCEAWYPKLNQDGKNYLYYVDKFIATFEPETQVKLLNLIPISELPTFLNCAISVCYK